MVYGFLGIGFVLFFVGSEAILRGGTGLFRALGVPRIFIGLLIAAFAMSAPEMSVALEATVHRAPDVVLGDLVGSNIASCLLVFGLGALLRPMPGSPKAVFRDGGTMILSSLAVLASLVAGFVARSVGVVLLCGWFAYLLLVFLTDWRRPPVLSATQARILTRNEGYGAGLSVFLLAFGAFCLAFGARFAVDCTAVLARELHVPEAAVALTLIAFGTTLPGLVGTLAVGSREPTSLASSQLIASNIFNLLLILGMAAVLRPLSVAAMIADFAGPIMAGSAILLMALLLPGWRLTRPQGGFIFAIYIGYLALVALRSGLRFG